MANWFTRALDVLTPWDRGGEVQRRNERKRREEEERRNRQRIFNQSQPTQRTSSEDPTPVSKRPRNIFEGLQKNLMIGQDRPGAVSVFKNQDTEVAQMPKPGEVVKPKQSFGDKIRDILDANTEADKYRRQKEGRAADYVESERELGIVNPRKNFAEQFLAAPVRLINTAKAGLGGVYGLGKIGKASLFGDDDEYRRTLSGVQESLDRDLSQDAGLFGWGTPFRDSKEVSTIGAADLAKRTVGTGAEAASFGVGGPAVGRVIGQGGRLLTREGLKRAAPSLVQTSGGGGLGAGGYELGSNEEATPASVGIATAVGSLLAPLLPLLGFGANKAIGNPFGRLLNRGRKVPKSPPVKEAIGDNLDVPASPPKKPTPPPQEPTSPRVRELENKVAQLTQEAGETNRPAYQRQPAKEALGKTKTELSDARAKELGVGESPLDRPAFKHQADMEDLVKQGNDELDNFIRENPNATPQQIDEAKAAIEGQVVKRADELTKARYGETGNVPDSQPITTKPVNNIPMTDQTVVPQNLPEAPGTVRVTEATAPMAAKTQAAAEVPVATKPVSLPKETQAILDNPKQYNKRQVAAARNQRKLAKQFAKTQEETSEAYVKGQVAKTARTGEPDIPKTGELGKSKGKFGKGETYEKTGRQVNREQGVTEASNVSYEKFVADVDSKTKLGARDRNTAMELQKRFKPLSPEHVKLGKIAGEANRQSAQILSTAERTARRTAGSKEITNNSVNKLYDNVDDPSKISDADFTKIETATDTFVKARDDFNVAHNKALDKPTKQNVDEFIKAMNKAAEADKAAKFAEYDVASKVAGKSEKANKFIRGLEQDAGVYTMDWVDSSMLSSTRVMINNYFNTLGVRVEEAAFGKPAARIASKLASIFHKTDVTIGGGSRAGRKLGRQLGAKQTISDMKLRQDAKGNALVKGIKNFTTTGNTLGERNIQDAVYGATYDHYKQGLKKAGYSGKELDNRAMIQTLTDPDKLADPNNVKGYMHQALVDNTLASASSGRTRLKIETAMANTIQDKLGGGQVAKNVAKLATRLTLGFPTVIARAVVGGTKRATFGGVSTAKAFANVARKGDPLDTARYFKQAVKEFGSGTTMMSLGAVLAANDRISGAYPKDKDQQAEWQREGKREYGIKIGSDWYDLPAALGVFAIPMFIGAKAGENISEGKPITDEFWGNAGGTIVNTMPIDSLTNVPSLLQDWERGRDVSKKLAGLGSSAVRGITPLGSLVNQVAKMFDPTANDTTKGNLLAQFTSKVMDGIPGLANQLPAREVEGKEIRNPSAISRLFGAVSTEQSGGVEKTEEIRSQIDESVSKLNEYGAFSDGVRNLLDDEQKALFDKAKSGEKLEESDLKGLMDDIVKGVTETQDTRFLEDGDYDNNLAVLKTKRDILAADPTTRRDTIDSYDEQIKRGEIYKSSKTPYDLIENYREISLTDWRKMGDSEKDEYDPEMYQRLWELDEQMAEAGVGRGKRGKAKYSAKKSGSGRGGRGRGSRKISTDFGTLKDGVFAPRVREYESIGGQAGSVPVIRKVRPNIVHKITASG